MAFVESKTIVMDHRIERHLHAVGLVTRPKRILAFKADKVTELHRTREIVGLMIVSEGGELQAVFCRLPLGYMPYGESSYERDLRQDVYEEVAVRS